MQKDTFFDFFDCCTGRWQTERTFHYLTLEKIERSRTEFTVTTLSNEQKQQLLTGNEYDLIGELDNFPGFNLKFYTISEKGQEVSQILNLMFIPLIETPDYLEGDYLRDQAFEEARPIISHFHFDRARQELMMTTHYREVVSVDSIILINPTLRLRRIINYQCPEPRQPLTTPTLVGFGVELKVS